jgi:hypothetical protein
MSSKKIDRCDDVKQIQFYSIHHLNTYRYISFYVFSGYYIPAYGPGLCCGIINQTVCVFGRVENIKRKKNPMVENIRFDGFRSFLSSPPIYSTDYFTDHRSFRRVYTC